MGAYFDKMRGWRWSFFYDKTRYQSKRAFETKRDALDAEAILRRSLTRRAAGLELDPTALPPAPRFSEWAGVYMAFVQEQARLGLLKRPEAIELTLRVVLRFFGARPEVPEEPTPEYPCPYHDLRLTDPIEHPAWLRDFEAWIQLRGVAKSTRNHYLNTLSRLYWLAQHPEYRHLASGVGINPFSYRPRTRWKRRTATVTGPQLLAWLSHASYHAKLAMAIAALAPKLRLANILALNWSDVDFARRVITVQAHKTDARGEPLVAPISTQLDMILRDAYQRHPEIASHRVVLYRNGPVKTIDCAVKAAALEAGLTWGRDVDHGVTFHTLRHSMSTLLARLGVSPLLHQQLMGHGDFATTRGYTHLEADDQRLAAEQLSQAVDIASVVIAKAPRVRRAERLSGAERTPERLHSSTRLTKGQNRLVRKARRIRPVAQMKGRKSNA
jgi:integrase